MIKHFCDFCGKEVFHMDVAQLFNKEICPDCMRVRCGYMIKTLGQIDLDRIRSDSVKDFYTALVQIINRFGLDSELKKITELATIEDRD